ncbi:UNVERIFIED_CONTAM: hypothetical protein GTU68_023332, partial [Idotea baltica]|nr:hypothetical protein [Idotea baltica]
MILQSIRNSFERAFAIPPTFIVRAPGRINLIGEHTDYNNGFVFPAAIDKYVYLAFAANKLSDGTRIFAKDLIKSVSIELDQLEKSVEAWENFLIGILLQFQEKGYSLKNFNCLIQSTIPIGAGMSSSSALECGFAKGIAQLHNIELNNWEILEMSHQSNHQFLGIKGGIMDQFSLLFGKKDQAMILDCKDRSYEHVPIDMEDHQWVLINTQVKHENLTSGYGDRVAECKEAAKLLGVESLREAKLLDLENKKESLSEIVCNRARFVISENERVHTFAQAMKEGDYTTLGNLLYDSHDGLQKLYEVSCEELDLLV